MQGDLLVMLLVICVQWKIPLCAARLNSAAPNDVASIKQMREDLVLGRREESTFQRVLNVTSELEWEGEVISDLPFC